MQSRAITLLLMLGLTLPLGACELGGREGGEDTEENEGGEQEND